MFRAFAALFVAVFLAQGFYAIGLKSPAFDETGDIAAGLSYVQSGQVRANLQHPPLLKEMAGVSLRAAGIRLPNDAQTQAMLVRGGERAVGSSLIAQENPARVMFWSRLPFLLV